METRFVYMELGEISSIVVDEGFCQAATSWDSKPPTLDQSDHQGDSVCRSVSRTRWRVLS
jgi:hypothetical protein